MTAPPVGLEPETFAERLYASLAPLAKQDADVGWSLLIYVNAIGGMFQLVEDWVRDTPEGDPGWSLLMDIDRCPDEALPWLGQFAGVRTLPGSTPEEMRQRIASTGGFARGTPAAMQGAAAATLTGQKTVVFRERVGGDAYALNVVTWTSETPNPTATLEALTAAKPGGIVLTYSAIVGQDYALLKSTKSNYNAVKSGYPDYDSVKLAKP